MKGAKTLLLALAAFGALGGVAAGQQETVQQQCEDRCTDGSSQAMAQCGANLQCIEDVQAGVNICLNTCAKMTPGSVPLVGAGARASQVGVDQQCVADCNYNWNACNKDCWLQSCHDQCYTTWVVQCTTRCLNGAEVKATPIPTPAPTPVAPIFPPQTPCESQCNAIADKAFQDCDISTQCIGDAETALDECLAQCPKQQQKQQKKKSTVGFYACEGCTGSYSQCADSCSAGDASCLNSCVNYFMGCMGQCDLSAVQATPVSMSCSSCKPAAAQCKSTCATIECDANCNFEYGKCANHCSNEVSLGATPVGDMKKQTMCKMACIGVEAAANTACKKWLPDSKVCLDNVAAARQMCDLGCELFKVSALPPVASSSCEAGCNSEYNQCVKSGSSPTTCFRAQKKCFDICHMSLASAESATMPALAMVAAAKSHKLKGIPCEGACLISKATASLLCYAYPDNLKQQCLDNTEKGLTICQFLCAFSPVMTAAEVEAPKAVAPVNVASPMRRVAKAVQTRVGDAECGKCAASLKSCFMGCNLDSQCIGRCFNADWQCQLNC